MTDSYIGVPPKSGFINTAKQRVTSSTNNYVDLDHAISDLSDVIVWVNSVKQDSTNLSLTNPSKITLGGTLTASDVCEIVYLGKQVATQSPDTGSVTNSMLAGSIDLTSKVTGALPQANIGDQAINEAKLQVSNAPTNGYMLTAQSGNTGGLTWAEAGSGTHVRVGGSSGSGDVADITYDNILTNDYYAYRIIGMMETTADAYMEILLRIGSSGSNSNAGGQYRQTWNGWASSSTDSYLVNAGDWGSNSIKPMSASRTNDGDDDHGVFFDMILYTRYLNKTYWRVNSQMLNNDKSRIYGYENVGWQSNTGDITGFNFYFNTGNIDNHRIDIYGVKSG